MCNRRDLLTRSKTVTTLAWLLSAVLLVPSAPSMAGVSVGPDLHGFYDGCIAKFTAAGMRDKVDQLDRSKNLFKFVRGNNTGSTPDSETRAGNGKGSGGETKINPTDTSKFDGEYPPIYADPCATLYHEMAHLVDYDNGQNDRRYCQNTGPAGIQIMEVGATREENRYRKTQPDLKAYLRTKYGARTELPPDGVPCVPVEPRPTGGCSITAVGAPSCAISSNDPHLTTFDQVLYDFQAVGEFVAVRSTTRDDLEIQVRQSPMPESPDASLNTAVAINVGGDLVGLYMSADGPKLFVNGRPQTLGQKPLPLKSKGVVRRLDTDEFSILWPDGSEAMLYQVGFRGFRLGVNLADGRRGTVEGLLGNFDGNPANDLRVRGGPLIREASFGNLYPRFADSWRIAQQDSLFQYSKGQSTQSFTNVSLPTRALEVDTLQNRQQAEETCRRAGVTNAQILRDCILDVGVSGAAVFAKSAANMQNVFLANVRPASAVAPVGASQGLTFSGRVSGQLFPATAECIILEAAKQFSVTLTGQVGGTKIELFVNVTEGYHGAGSYSIGSPLSNGGQATLGFGNDALATNSSNPGSVRVNPGDRSGDLNASLGGVDIKGQWRCGKLTRL